MHNFFDEWESFKQALTDRKIFLFLDFDGTLSPIVSDPREAGLAPETRLILDRLSQNEQCLVAIVSGRAVDDLKERVGLKRLIYVGNHGFEIMGPQIRFKNHYFPQARDIYNKVLSQLADTFKAMPDVLVEDKRITVSLHVRRLTSDQKSLFKASLYRTIKPHIILKDIHMREGKEVYELRPAVEWDKGQAVLWLLKTYNAPNIVSMYIGDDQTDEDAFKVLQDNAITIHVGGDVPTAAKFCVEGTQDVIELLRRIDSLLSASKERPKAAKLYVKDTTPPWSEKQNLFNHSIVPELNLENKFMNDNF